MSAIACASGATRPSRPRRAERLGQDLVRAEHAEAFLAPARARRRRAARHRRRTRRGRCGPGCARPRHPAAGRAATAAAPGRPARGRGTHARAAARGCARRRRAGRRRADRAPITAGSAKPSNPTRNTAPPAALGRRATWPGSGPPPARMPSARPAAAQDRSPSVLHLPRARRAHCTRRVLPHTKMQRPRRGRESLREYQRVSSCITGSGASYPGQSQCRDATAARRNGDAGRSRYAIAWRRRRASCSACACWPRKRRR